MTAPSKRLQMLEAMIAKGTKDPFVRYAHGLEVAKAERDEHARSELQTALDAL